MYLHFSTLRIFPHRLLSIPNSISCAKKNGNHNLKYCCYSGFLTPHFLYLIYHFVYDNHSRRRAKEKWFSIKLHSVIFEFLGSWVCVCILSWDLCSFVCISRLKWVYSIFCVRMWRKATIFIAFSLFTRKRKNSLASIATVSPWSIMLPTQHLNQLTPVQLAECFLSKANSSTSQFKFHLKLCQRRKKQQVISKKIKKIM